MISELTEMNQSMKQAKDLGESRHQGNTFEPGIRNTSHKWIALVRPTILADWKQVYISNYHGNLLSQPENYKINLMRQRYNRKQ